MKVFMRNPRTGLPALAVLVALVLSFAVPPFNSVIAQGSSSSMSSSSSGNFDCNNTFSGGDIKPGDTVRGVLTLNKGNGCRFTAKVHVELNGKSLDKDPDQNGDVSVSVKTNTDGKTAVLDDPVDVSVHTGRNDVNVSGDAVEQTNGATGTASIDAFFTLAAPTTTTAPPNTAFVTPVAATTSGGGGGSLARTGLNLFALFLLALVAIALGTYTVAVEQAMPFAAGAGAGAIASTVSVPLFEPPLGGTDTWTLELVVLTAVSYILGPPPGRHAKKGPRGLVPMVRDWMYREP